MLGQNDRRSAVRTPFVTFLCTITFGFVVSALSAADFIRGDVNGDGKVSLADAHALTGFFFLGTGPLECGDAGDVDDNGELEISDTIGVLGYVALGWEPPPPPFPEPGPDPTPDSIDERWPCDTVPDGSPLADPGAELRVLDMVASGGNDRQAQVVIALSSSTPLAGYWGVVETGGIFDDRELSDADFNDGVFDLSDTYFQGFLAARTEGSRLHFGYLVSIVHPLSILAGENQPVLQIELCLKEGVSAGQHPLTLLEGELVDYESARRVDPELVSGTLTVPSDAGSVDCVIQPTTAVQAPDYDVEFRLGTLRALPGTDVAVPFFIRTTGPGHGYFATFDFDERVLQIQGVEPVFSRPDGEDYWRTPRINNNNENPGGEGVDEGWVRLIAHIAEPYDEINVIPPDEDVIVANLLFSVSPDAEQQVSEVRFVGEHCEPDPHDICYAHSNVLIARGWVLTPELVNSFVFINGRLNITLAVSTFIRGDSNGDDTVDLSDAVTTLHYLFIGDDSPYCLDAADANDDGLLNIGDPIATLQFLFLEGAPLPPPNGIAGEDPTPDDLSCE